MNYLFRCLSFCIHIQNRNQKSFLKLIRCSFESENCFRRKINISIWHGKNVTDKAAINDNNNNHSKNNNFLFGIFILYTYSVNLTNNYMFKVIDRNTRTRCEICSKFLINTPERCNWSRSGVFIVNFKHIWHLALVFLLLTLITLSR